MCMSRNNINHSKTNVTNQQKIPQICLFNLSWLLMHSPPIIHILRNSEQIDFVLSMRKAKHKNASTMASSEFKIYRSATVRVVHIWLGVHLRWYTFTHNKNTVNQMISNENAKYAEQQNIVITWSTKTNPLPLVVPAIHNSCASRFFFLQF